MTGGPSGASACPYTLQPTQRILELLYTVAPDYHPSLTAA